MQDPMDMPAPSGLRPVLYGVAVGAAAMAIFFAAYVVAPDLTLPGTALIALGFAALVLMASNAVPTRAGAEVAALARGETPPSVAGGAQPPGEVALLEREARVAELRAETDGIDRRNQPTEWMDRVRALGDELKALAIAEMMLADRKRQRAGLAHHRQAVGIYRRIVAARGQSRSSRDWGTAQIALGECLLVLGEAEGARDEVLEAVNAFTAGLDVAELTPAERAVGDDGLAQAEGVLASMAEQADRTDRDLI